MGLILTVGAFLRPPKKTQSTPKYWVYQVKRLKVITISLLFLMLLKRNRFKTKLKLNFFSSHEARSWAGGSFLAAVSSYSDDDDEQTGRVCLLDDDEHCDDTYQDVSQVEGVVSDEEEGLTLDDIVSDQYKVVGI
ncbi:hypothetical protein DPMN_121926 [Dreissena polymorpha]|uniref:Uncharacterized protein n=1 Tax=Dreissena polymorpha TaxID=45954 RepID=A0A9D4GNP2_DREPO|nr:hypothetical protein DPMN_121926 [Dreissena polymorpha]